MMIEGEFVWANNDAEEKSSSENTTILTSAAQNLNGKSYIVSELYKEHLNMNEQKGDIPIQSGTKLQRQTLCSEMKL
jgi:hypothetical protein